MNDRDVCGALEGFVRGYASVVRDAHRSVPCGDQRVSCALCEAGLLAEALEPLLAFAAERASNECYVTCHCDTDAQRAIATAASKLRFGK